MVLFICILGHLFIYSVQELAMKDFSHLLLEDEVQERGSSDSDSDSYFEIQISDRLNRANGLGVTETKKSSCRSLRA